MAIPVTILTGFLGAGKTTLLNRVLKAPQGRELAVVVNDFGEVNVDAALVVGFQGEKVRLENGCICCSLREDLEKCLLDLISSDPGLEGILVEASGLADPGPLAQTFALSEPLRAVAKLDSIIAVVDCEAFPYLSGKLAYLGRRQVAAADLVLLNKADLVDTEQLGQIKSELGRWVPGVRLVESHEANIPVELLLGVGRFSDAQVPEGEAVEVHLHQASQPGHSSCSHLHLQAWTFRSAGVFQVDKLIEAFQRIPQGVLRAKGFLRLDRDPKVRYLLQLCGTRFSFAPQGNWDEPAGNELVFLGLPGEMDCAELESILLSCKTQSLTGPILDFLKKHYPRAFALAR
jgi:G3E family GTPase